MNALDWFFVAIAVALVASVIGWLIVYSREAPKDPVINVDQWGPERRAHLATLNQPAAKGWQGRRRSS